MSDNISQRQARLLGERPRPLADAAGQVSQVVGVLGALVTGLVGFGIFSVVQGDALVGLLGLIPGLVTAVVSALSAFGVVRRAEPQVTPLADPRDAEMRQLRPAA